MEIRGLQKTSVLDFPDQICCIIFTPYCSFKCPFCYNKYLVQTPEKLDKIDDVDFFSFLDERKHLIDGVCISGGEPTLQKDLPVFISKIKKIGLLVKLDTNGSNPDMLKQLLIGKLVDYVAMDIKAPFDKYSQVAGVRVDIDKIKESVKIIRNSNVDYEFRSTVVKGLLSYDDLLSIANDLKGSKRFYLQKFQPLDSVIDKKLDEDNCFSDDEMKDFALKLKPYFQFCESR